MMARGRGQARAASTRSKKRTPTEDNGLSTAYRDMLAEAEAESSPTQTGDEGRPIKRRRVRGRIVTQDEISSSQVDSRTNLQELSTGQQGNSKQGREVVPPNDEIESQRGEIEDGLSCQEQTADKDETSEESDFAWEEVDLAHDADQPMVDSANEYERQNLDLVLEGEERPGQRQSAVMRRKTLTAIERKLRLEVHKVHLLCLLFHVHLRNHWCNDQNVHVRSDPALILPCKLRHRLESTISPAAQANRLPPESRRESSPVPSRRELPTRARKGQ